MSQSLTVIRPQCYFRLQIQIRGTERLAVALRTKDADGLTWHLRATVFIDGENSRQKISNESTRTKSPEKQGEEKVRSLECILEANTFNNYEKDDISAVTKALLKAIGNFKSIQKSKKANSCKFCEAWAT